MTKTIADELESIVAMLGEKYPDHGDDEIASLVHDVFTRLSSEATVTNHLIPLTVNRCHEVLRRRGIQSTKALGPASR